MNYFYAMTSYLFGFTFVIGGIEGNQPLAIPLIGGYLPMNFLVCH